MYVHASTFVPLNLTNTYSDLNPMAKRDYFEFHWEADGVQFAGQTIERVVCAYYKGLLKETNMKVV